MRVSAVGAVLFLSSFAPLLVVFGLLHSFGSGVASYVCYAVAAGSIVALLRELPYLADTRHD